MKGLCVSYRLIFFFFWLISPPLDYDSSHDLYDQVYPNTTVLQFEVIVIDNGTVPRGASAAVNINISNTCLMDVEYGDIDYWITVSDSTGEMFLRIPKYFVFPYGEYR